MAEIFKEFLQNYTGEIIFAALTAIVGFIGTALKKEYEEASEDKKKREVIASVVRSTEQIYKNLHGSDKLQKAMETASKMLAQKGISITDLELMVLIESALCEFNNAFNKASWEEGLKKATSISEEVQETEEEPEEGEAVEEETEVTVG